MIIDVNLWIKLKRGIIMGTGSVTPFVFLLIGLVVGIVATIVVVVITGFGAGKKAEKIISAAKKEADRNKRDALAELKQEQFKMKQEAEKC